MSASTKRVHTFCAFFTRLRGGSHAKRGTDFVKDIQSFTPEEIYTILRTIGDRGHAFRRVSSYIRTCPSNAKEISLEEIKEAYELLHVKEVLES